MGEKRPDRDIRSSSLLRNADSILDVSVSKLLIIYRISSAFGGRGAEYISSNTVIHIAIREKMKG